MKNKNKSFEFEFEGHVKILDETNNKVLLDKKNAIHPQNMARIISRGLANEENSQIFRLAFGNGGTFIDAGGNIVFLQPNDGNNGSGWEARLYRETYSEIVDEANADFGSDPGSAGPDNVRVGGGSFPSGDPSGGGVISEEIGKKSNIIISMTINENEPSGQLNSQSSPSPTLEESEDTFIFDEIGLYSSGLPAVNTSGVSSVDVGNKTSEDDISPALSGSTNYALRITLDSTTQDAVITTPAAGSGSGTSGAFTYGDLAEGLNTGNWISSGFDFSGSSGAFFFITDRSGGAYPSITGQESFGFFTVQSKTIGSSSSIVFPEDQPIGGNDNLIFILANNIWSNANVNTVNGQDAGIINDSANQNNERERLLSHIVFTPILKSATSIIRIEYTITVSVSPTQDSDTTVSQPSIPQPSIPQPSIPQPSITPTPTVTPTITPTATAIISNFSFSVASEDTSPQSIFFKPDGTKMYMMGNTSDIVYQYTLSTPWDISTASFDSVSFSVISEDTTPLRAFFKPDGTKMYMIGAVTDTVYQYTLSTPWDLNTASFDSVSFSVASEDTNTTELFFKSDGTKMYIMGTGSDIVYQYTLFTPWDISTASFDTVSFSVGSEDVDPRGLFFKSDGTKMYMIGSGSDSVYQYTLSTPWDISTASFDSVSFSVESEDVTPHGLFFKSDGTKMYMIGVGTDTVYQYNLSTPWDISTASF